MFPILEAYYMHLSPVESCPLCHTIHPPSSIAGTALPLEPRTYRLQRKCPSQSIRRPST